MATQRQKKLAKAIVDNIQAKKPLNAKELVVSSGYSKNTASQQVPAVFKQKGVQEELEKLGFTESNAKSVVAEIMMNKDADFNARLKASDQVFKVHGSYAPEKKDITTKGEKLNLSDEKIAEINEIALDE